MKTNEAFEKWTGEHLKTDGGLSWPSETLVRLFKGSYVPGLDKNYAGKSVLDISCGNGNNLFFLATLGLRPFGTEVTQDICTSVTEKLAKMGCSANITVGTNRSLPFADNTFDYLVSWNVVHYEDNEADIVSAIAEYARVLKKGGRFFVSTTGPEHLILKGSEKIGPHRYRIGRPDDFRKGQVFFYFDTAEYVREYFGRSFKDILVGRTHDFMLTDTLDWWIATGVK